MTPRTPQRADAGIHVLLISAMYPRPGDSVLGIVVRREVDVLRARACTSEVIGKAPGWWGYAVQAREALRALRREYDVVHAHFGTSAFVAAAVRLGRRGRPPLVVTLHGSDVATGWRPQRDKYWLQFWLSYLGCLAARRVLVQDEGHAGRAAGPVRRRAEVLGQGIDPPALRRRTRATRAMCLFLSDRARPVKRFSLAQAAVSLARTEVLRLDSLDRRDVEAIPPPWHGPVLD